jgi:hypothetical protein
MYCLTLVFLFPCLADRVALRWCSGAPNWCSAGKAFSVADNRAVEKNTKILTGVFYFG